MAPDFTIVEDSIRNWEEYGKVPISYRVAGIFEVVCQNTNRGGVSLEERAIQVPYTKDYDALAGEGPSRWARNWNVSNWGVISAFDGPRRIGGCVLAWRTEGLELLEGREDFVVLWDIRVHPDERGRGIGSALFSAAVAWARDRRCRLLRVETQNTNVPACRFYAAQGCVLLHVHRFAYPDLPDEVQLIWELPLEEAPTRPG
ncbi:MAG: GNAT family N-acetyltransferase [Verrucomicrobiae bacterium]|nr:GNAT family N-acetyltransferase [Verrucomicrobiae bacterium]